MTCNGGYDKPGAYDVTWIKIDDQFADHPKVIQAGPLAGWLYVCGLTYAGRYLTDGFIPAGQLRKLADVDNAPELAERLVAARLWEEADGGYMIHDYLKYNPSRAEVEAERESRAKRQAEWRAKHMTGTERDANESERDAVSNTVTKHATNTRPVPVPVPVPDKKDKTDAQTPPDGGGGSDSGGHNQIRARLEAHFANRSGLATPKTASDKDRRQAGSLWWGPLREIAELTEWDEGNAIWLIDETLDRMRCDRLTVSSPKSILNVAKSIHADKHRVGRDVLRVVV